MGLRTVGVEEELLLVDPAAGTPVPGYDDLVAEARRRRTDPPEHELKQEQAEIASAPFEAVPDIVTDLLAKRADLIRLADAQGLGVVASGTAPLHAEGAVTRSERFDRMTERFGALTAHQLTCGMHVHVAVDSPGQGVAVLDRIRPWLHVLTALSANSPFWHGEDTGYASYRTIVWGQWPTAGPTSSFGTADGYERVVTGLLDSGTILDDGMIYFDARLSRHYPTVEIRVSDVCTDTADAGLIAALTRALVDTAAGDPEPAPDVPVELLRVAAWGAARFGVTGGLVDPVEARERPAADVIDRLLDLVTPALRDAGDEDLVRGRLLGRLSDAEPPASLTGPSPSDDEQERRGRAAGAQAQRAAFAASGSLVAVVTDLIERTRGGQQYG